MTGGVAAALTGGNIAIAAVAGGNAAENNYLTHQQEIKRDKELASCQTSACTVGVKLKYAGISAMQDAGLLIGIGGGIGYQTAEQAAAVIDMVKNWEQTVTSLNALVKDPEFRAKVGNHIADDYQQRIDMQIKAYNEGGWEGSVTAGVEAGRLAVDIVGAAATAIGTGKLVTITVKAGGAAIADSATVLAIKAAKAFDSLDAASQAKWLSETSSWRSATTQLADMEMLAGKGSHPLLRHGDQVELKQLQERANVGVSPDGVNGNPVDSTKWLNNQDMLTAIKQAQAQFTASGGKQLKYEADFGRVIGEGYYKGTTNYAQANKFLIALDKNGLPRTAYPILK
jgi:hypothetical protein